MLEELKYKVWTANKKLPEQGLVTFSQGGASGIDREQGLFVINPSGVSYCDLRPEHMTVVDLSGNVIEGEYAPAADMPAHLELYKAFPNCGGIVRAHSSWATAFAQACKPIPPFGTIHADHFYGEIPATRLMTKTEIENSYEKNIGLIIIEAFKNLDPEAVPGVLVSGHGPWSWGSSPSDAVNNAVAMENIARLALCSMTLTPGLAPISQAILDKHYQLRKGNNTNFNQE